MRKPVRALAAASLILGPTALAFFSGGFFERPRLVAGIAVWVLVVVAVLVVDDPLPGRRAWLAVGALALLTLWTGLSYEWAPLGERAQEDVQRLMLYLGAFVAGVLLLRGPAVRRALEPAIAAGAAMVTVYGMGDRLLPGLLTYHHSQSADGRLEQPITYWNAMGCIAAIGLVLCARLAADGRRPPALRGVAAGMGVPLGVGLYLSFSRGALLAAAVGVWALVILTPTPRAQLRALATVIAGGALASVVAHLLPRVNSLPLGTHGSTGQGLAMLGVLVGLAVLVGVLTARTGVPAPPESAPRRRWRGIAVVGGLVAAAVIATVAAASQNAPPPNGREATSAKRFASTDSLRYSYWRVSLRAFRREPLKGTGSGGFAVEWQRQPDQVEPAVDAHSLYVETAGELGLVGLALLGVLLGSVAMAARQEHRRDAAWVLGPAAALLVWTVHAGLDWDWELPAVSGIAVILAAAIVTGADEEPRPVAADSPAIAE